MSAPNDLLRPLINSPLWRERPAEERVAWWARCAPLLRIDHAPAPFDGLTEALVDLTELTRALNGLDLTGLAGVPTQAVPKRQLATLAGRLCAEAALVAQGEALAQVIGRDDAGGPVWPAGWTGSIAHGGGVAIAAVGRAGGGRSIGVDTEARIDAASTQRAVLTHCIHPSERAVVHGRLMGESTLQPDLLTLVFAAKEAYYKAVRGRVGRLVGFQEMVLQPLDATASGYTLWPAAGAAADLPTARGSAQWVGGRVVARVAVAGPPTDRSS